MRRGSRATPGPSVSSKHVVGHARRSPRWRGARAQRAAQQRQPSGRPTSEGCRRSGLARLLGGFRRFLPRRRLSLGFPLSVSDVPLRGPPHARRGARLFRRRKRATSTAFSQRVNRRHRRRTNRRARHFASFPRIFRDDIFGPWLLCSALQAPRNWQHKSSPLLTLLSSEAPFAKITVLIPHGGARRGRRWR